MSGEFGADTPVLRSAGLGLQVLAETVMTAQRRLSIALDAEGPCWGDDEAGRKFAEAYRPAEQGLRVALAHVGQRLVGIGNAAAVLADIADAANDSARRRMS